MPILRTTMFRSQALRSFLRAPSSSPVRIQARFATQDYGSGTGDPKGEKPQEQGKNPMSHLEHPGPESPNVGAGKSSSSLQTSEGGKSGGQTKTASGEAKTEGKQDGSGKEKRGAKPKILNEATPVEESESTKKHNEEMDQRHNRPNEQLGKE